MRLSIVIPAYNEEESIDGIIQRCLAARAVIQEKTAVEHVDITVVSDGSSDKTVEFASKYDDIQLIQYEKNRGYGAAIKLGFASSQGDLVAFLDADGTCDPLFFADLVNLLLQKDAHIALGSRMHPNSEIPKIRRLGNTVFAGIINFFANTSISDSASGMRVIQREALQRIYPLPDGLHFTPAMSAKAVLDRSLKIVEIPMSYKERTGESKLHVIHDGIRFLRTILNTAAVYVPQKMFQPIGLFLLLTALWLGIPPLQYYFQQHSVEDVRIYRLLSVLTLGVAGISVLLIGQIANEVCGLIHPGSEKNRLFLPIYRNIFNRRGLTATGILLFISGCVMLAPLVYQRLQTGVVDMVQFHWAYILTALFLLLLGIQLGALGLLLRITLLLREKTDQIQNES